MLEYVITTNDNSERENIKRQTSRDRPGSGCLFRCSTTKATNNQISGGINSTGIGITPENTGTFTLD